MNFTEYFLTFGPTSPGPGPGPGPRTTSTYHSCQSRDENFSKTKFLLVVLLHVKDTYFCAHLTSRFDAYIVFEVD
jgi:hypothetical protein